MLYALPLHILRVYSPLLVTEVCSCVDLPTDNTNLYQRIGKAAVNVRRIGLRKAMPK